MSGLFDLYVLDGTDVIKIEGKEFVELIKSGAWIEPDRRVAFDTLPDGTEISTVLLYVPMLGLTCSHGTLFETAVFYKDGTEIYGRTNTYEKALESHSSALESVAGWKVKTFH